MWENIDIYKHLYNCLCKEANVINIRYDNICLRAADNNKLKRFKYSSSTQQVENWYIETLCHNYTASSALSFPQQTLDLGKKRGGREVVLVTSIALCDVKSYNALIVTTSIVRLLLVAGDIVRVDSQAKLWNTRRFWPTDCCILKNDLLTVKFV